MGEEFAAATPFLYFCDFGPELAASVARGRRDEFKRFAAFADAAKRERIPDPNAEATLRACTLRWDERTQSPHAERLVLIGGLLALRSQWLMPRLAAMRHGGRWRVDGDVLDVRWTLGDGSTWSLAANFGATTAPLVRDGQTVFALRADETRLLGDGVHVGLEPPHA